MLWPWPASRFRIGKKIANGAFGQLRLVKDLVTGEVSGQVFHYLLEFLSGMCSRSTYFLLFCSDFDHMLKNIFFRTLQSSLNPWMPKFHRCALVQKLFFSIEKTCHKISNKEKSFTFSSSSWMAFKEYHFFTLIIEISILRFSHKIQLFLEYEFYKKLGTDRALPR